MKLIYTFLLLMGLQHWTEAGGIRGSIKDTKGQAMPYASVVVKGTTYGSMANQDGLYEIALLPGSYEIVFQFLGYQTEVRKVTVAQDFLTLNVALSEQTIALQEVKVKSANEDPANTIMRKAIAMARIHALEVDSYTARAYMKGGGKITNIPALFESRLKKEGIQENVVYFTETITDVSFKQPKSYTQRVVSTRNNFGEVGGYNQFFNASFYQPEVGGAVSPLSPKAFGYYRFEYLGTFSDRGYEVSKIRVTPRSKGDNVFDGTIYIIEQIWSIHSLNLSTLNDGFRVDVKQIFSPIQEVWMPVTQQFAVGGGILGFKGQFNYNITVSNYRLKVNPKFHRQVEVVDEKIDKTPTAVERVNKPNSKQLDIEKTLSQSKELNRKQLNKLVKEYEKQEQKERKKVNANDAKIVRQDSISVDSLARKRPAAFWDTLRPVPLTELEVKSTFKLDSTRMVLKAKETKDSVKKNTNKFKVMQLLTGHTYPLGKPDTLKNRRGEKYAFFRTKLVYESPLTSIAYNTVEGYRLKGSLGLRYDARSGRQWQWTNHARYGIGRQKLLGFTELSQRYKRNTWNAAVGTDVQQFAPEAGIDEGINTLTTLLLERHWIKLFQKEFAKLTFTSKRTDGLEWQIGAEWQRRFSLNSLDIKPWIDIKNRTYESNEPRSAELAETGFGTHEALIFNAQLRWRPIVRYRLYNGRKSLDYSSSPELLFRYRAGVPQALGSDVAFQHAEVSLKHSVEFGVRGRLSYAASAGTFWNDRPIYFIDFKHFTGNLSPLAIGDPVSNFRMLDYYQYSTRGGYLEAHGLYGFRKFLFTQIPAVRIMALKENVFAHYLHTNRTGLHYLEIGYGLDGIFRLLRAEVVTNFVNGQYQHTAIRLGLNSKIQIGGN